MNRLLTAAAALTILTMASHPAIAQVGGDEPLATCTIVIDLQYSGDRSRDGDCIGMVSDWLVSIGAPSAATDVQVVETIIDLTELYRPEECPGEETELPEAIETAAAAIVDDEQRAEVLLIAEQINNCEFDGTAAVDDDLLVPGTLSPTSGSPS